MALYILYSYMSYECSLYRFQKSETLFWFWPHSSNQKPKQKVFPLIKKYGFECIIWNSLYFSLISRKSWKAERAEIKKSSTKVSSLVLQVITSLSAFHYISLFGSGKVVTQIVTHICLEKPFNNTLKIFHLTYKTLLYLLAENNKRSKNHVS